MAGGGLRKVQELAQTVLNCRAIHAIHSNRRRSGPLAANVWADNSRRSRAGVIKVWVDGHFRHTMPPWFAADSAQDQLPESSPSRHARVCQKIRSHGDEG